MGKVKVLLKEKDFESLIKGQIIKRDNVEIALSDIGYFKMLEILNDAIVNQRKGK